MATIYISPTGNDTTGNGTLGNPYQTISKAHTVASNGDTIYCLAGTYTWVSQTFSKSLTVTAPSPVAGVPVAIFDAGSACRNWIINSGITLNIVNLQFQNLVQTSSDVVAFGGSLSATYILTMTNCVLYNFGLARGPNQRGGIFGCSVQNESGGSVSGTVTLSSCVFWKIYKTSGETDGVIISIREYGGLYGNSITFQNCVIYVSDTTQHLDFVVMIYDSVAPTVEFINCICLNVGTAFPFHYTGTGNLSTASYSCIEDAGFTSEPSGTGVITSDPLMVDPANGDFHLSQTSPCRGAGVIL